MKVLPVSPEALAEAVAVLRAGGIVAHATETCYGFACDLTNPEAVERLFTLKQRPLDQPVSALFVSVEQAKQYVEWNKQAEELANQYLPGPLTIILPVRADAPILFSVPVIFPPSPNPFPRGGKGDVSVLLDAGENEEECGYYRKKPLHGGMLQHARDMRKQPTPAEERLWKELRFDQLGVRFRRQHPLEGMILDFYCHEAKLGIEVDGGIHDTEGQEERDYEREEKLLFEHSIRLLRFQNEEVLKNTKKVLQTIQKHVQEQLHKHSPSPRGGGGKGVGEKFSGGRGRGVGEKTKKQPTLGIRLSSHPVAQKLVEMFGSPLSTTSANLHGQPNPYSVEEIFTQFRGMELQPDLVLDSGTLPRRQPSTVVVPGSGNAEVVRGGEVMIE